METPVPDSVSAVQNVKNAMRDVESEYEADQEGKIREIVMDIDSEPSVSIIAQLFPSNYSLVDIHVHRPDTYLESIVAQY